MDRFSTPQPRATHENALEDERRASLPVKDQCRLLWGDVKAWASEVSASMKSRAASARDDMAQSFASGHKAAAGSPDSYVWTKRLLFIGVAVAVCLWALTRMEPPLEDEKEATEEARLSLFCQIPGTTCKDAAPQPKGVVAPDQQDAIIFPTEK